MKTTLLLVTLLSVALSEASIRRVETRDYIQVCSYLLAPVCDTEGNDHPNNCTLRQSGAQYDGSRCYNWNTNECEFITETGCPLPSFVQ